MEKDPAFDKLVWWRDDQGQTQRTLIARVMTMGTWDDILEGLQVWGKKDFGTFWKTLRRESLTNGPGASGTSVWV